MAPRLSHRLLAEFLGTALLLCTVIGSGIMGERLASGQVAVALLANTLATVFILFVLIGTLGPISGAHFNPLVSLAFGRTAGLSARTQAAYAVVQAGGAVAGALCANAMFAGADASGGPLLQWASHVRTGPGLWLGELVATAGLVLVIGLSEASQAPARVAAYIGAAYWFTSSTSFANPVAVLGRMFSDSFAGIAPVSAPAFVIAQCAGAALGLGTLRALGRRTPP